MARTSRRTKHRGNAAGMIEARGRTGRKLTSSEKASAARSSGSPGARNERKNKYDSPPTWKGSFVRAVIAAGIVYALSTLLLGKHTNALSNLVIVPVVLAIYTPMIYYTDLYMHRRRLRKKSAR